MTAPPAARCVEFELPPGWWCLDLRSDGASERIDELARRLGREIPADMTVGDVSAGDADCLLFRPAAQPGDLAITGCVVVRSPLPVSGVELHDQLAERGEFVALSDLGGMPVVSLVRRPAASALEVTYFVVADDVCLVLIFVAPATPDPQHAIAELARVVSAARAVR